MDIPKTADDARNQGYTLEEITAEEAKTLMEKSVDHRFESMIARAKDCSTLKQGDLCWEGNCGPDGEMDVLYCNGTQGCTIRGRVRCR